MPYIKFSFEGVSQQHPDKVLMKSIVSRQPPSFLEYLSALIEAFGALPQAAIRLIVTVF